MTRTIPSLCFLLLAAACMADETISGFADPSADYVLEGLDGRGFAAAAVIRFPEEGQVTGRAPCNAFGGEQTAPYPWFELGPVRATRAACADMAAERAFFEALGAMTLAEVNGPVVILSNEAGREMVFRRAP